MGLLEFLTTTIGIDPGSQSLRIIHNGNIVFNQTSEVSINRESGSISGFGNQINSSDHVIKPLNSVITDFEAFELLLRNAVKKTFGEPTFNFRSYRMYISVPISGTGSELRTFRDSAEHASARELYMVRQPCASAIAMNILFSKKDFILIDFSASKVEMTAFSSSVPIAHSVTRIGTWKLKQVLKNYIFRTYGITPSFEELESILKNEPNSGKAHKVAQKAVETNEIIEVLNPYFTMIEDQVLETLEGLSAHKKIDQIIANGFYFTGGGSTMNWVVKRIALNGKINFKVSSNPFLDSINGVNKIMKNPEQFKSYLIV